MKILRVSTILLVCMLSACASLKPGFETPSVQVSSFQPLPSEGLAPRFQIGLRVVNPNADALKLRGVSYQVSLDGYQIVEGAANDLPVVPGYGEAEFKVMAAVSLLDAMRFVNALMTKQGGQVKYRLQAKLDVGAMLPSIRVEESGLLGIGNGQAL